MAAARALDEKIRIETEVHTRTERDIDNVEVQTDRHLINTNCKVINTGECAGNGRQ
jgi:hypothetical protein